ncbi:MAG: hypothetical protein EA398_03580 [Deltaproteobacteria bacterium]|nr:MAG: hypothetical protein EA398_03580 [Deltaproteobacteria bacterium]
MRDHDPHEALESEPTAVRPVPAAPPHDEAADWLRMAYAALRPLPAPRSEKDASPSAPSASRASAPIESASRVCDDTQEAATPPTPGSPHASTQAAHRPRPAAALPPAGAAEAASAAASAAAGLRRSGVLAAGTLAALLAGTAVALAVWLLPLTPSGDGTGAVVDSRTIHELPPQPDGFAPVVAGRHRIMTAGTERVQDGVREIVIPVAVWIQDHPVTESEWVEGVGAPVEGLAECGPRCPVVRVSFVDALAFANARSEREGLAPCYALDGCTGHPGSRDHACERVRLVGGATHPSSCEGYRLPTEPEWAVAARVDSFLADLIGERPPAWHRGNSGNRMPEVAGWPANDGGFHDMVSLVQEWVWDPYAFAPRTEEMPPMPADDLARQRTLRGQAWSIPLSALDTSARSGASPRLRSGTVGFRLARTVPGASP